jgi:hypothetical protein
MATAAQVAANRRNALRSTGPRTAAGKRRSAANATKHQLQSTPETLFTTNPTERTQFENLLESLLPTFSPTTTKQTQLLHEYAFALFQLRRASRYEDALLASGPNEPNLDSTLRRCEQLARLAHRQQRAAARLLAALKPTSTNEPNTTKPHQIKD